MKERLCICVKNPFSERDFERMSIEALEGHFDVLILDCTAWLMPEAFITRGKSRFSRPNLRFIHSLKELKSVLGSATGGFAVDYVGQFSLKALLLFNELKTRGMKLIVVDSGAHPAHAPSFWKRTLLERFTRPIPYGGVRMHLNAAAIKLLMNLLPDQTPDFALVSGSSWKSTTRFTRARVKIPAHSFDYDLYLRGRNDAPLVEYPYAVYLDEKIDGHEDNVEHMVENPASTRFWRALIKLFDEFEAATGLAVLIAGYPSANQGDRAHCFGGRKLLTGQTSALIRDAKLVFAHGSTAVSYAVMGRRPVVFLTSDEISRSWYQPSINLIRDLLNAPMVNIDLPMAKSDPEKWLKIDTKAFESYEETYIKSNESPDTFLSERFLAVARYGKVKA